MLVALGLLIFIRPIVGVSLALLLGPLGALENIVLGNALLDSGQLMLLFTIGVWLLRGLAMRRIRPALTPLMLPLALFIGIGILSLLGADSIPLGLIELLKWVEIGLLVVLVMDLAFGLPEDSARPVSVTRQVIFALLLAGLSQAVVGIWQFGLRGHGPEHFLVLGRFYRAYGTYEQPNPFGGYMNLTALLAAGILIGLLVARLPLLFGRGASQGKALVPWRFWALFAALCVLACGLAVVFSWSRGAWLGLLAGAGTLVLFSARRLWFGALLALGLGGALLALMFLGSSMGIGPAQSLLERLGGFGDDLAFGDVRGVDINDENYAVLERLAHWQAAIDMARDDVWLGVGLGNYEAAYPDYALINWPDALGHAHNYYLNLLAETGALGLGAYLLFWVVVFWQNVRQLGRLNWPERGVSLGLMAGWVALSVHHLVDKLYVNNLYIHLGVMLALLQLLDWPGFRGDALPDGGGEPLFDAGAVGRNV